MRLFVGLEPTPALRRALCEVQMQLRAAGVEGSCLSPANLHMTLAFIGEWPGDAAEALPEITEPFPITLSHLGVFTRAKVLWAGVKPSEELCELAAEVRRRLDALEIPYDRQDFNPHMTLIRKPILPGPQTLEAVRVPPAAMLVREVCLYQSVREPDGMRYTVIGRSKSRAPEADGAGV